jgi:hypothetical protein
MAATTRSGEEVKEIESAKIYFNRETLKKELKDIQASPGNSKSDIFFSLLYKDINSLIEGGTTSPVVLRFAIEELKALYAEFSKLNMQVSRDAHTLLWLADKREMLHKHLRQGKDDSAAAFFRKMFTEATPPKMASAEEKNLDNLAHRCYLKIQELAQGLPLPEDEKESLSLVIYAKHISFYTKLNKIAIRIKKINDHQSQDIELRQDLAKLILTNLTLEEKHEENKEALLKFQDSLWKAYVGLPLLTVESPYSMRLRAEYHLLKLHNAIYHEQKNERNSTIKAIFFDLIKLFNESKNLPDDSLCVGIRAYCSTEAFQALTCKNEIENNSYMREKKVAPKNILTILTNLNALSKQLNNDNSIESILGKTVYENIVRFFLQELSLNDNPETWKKLSELIAEVDSRLRGEGTPGKLEELALFFPKQSSTGKLIAGIVCLVLAVGAIALFSSIGDAALTTVLAKELLAGGAAALILTGIALIISSRSSGLAKSINQVIGAKPLLIAPVDAASESQSSLRYNQ